MIDSSEIEWEDERLPQIKKELADHGLAVVTVSSQDVGKGLVSCVFWLGVLCGTLLIGAGASENRVLGAGIGIIACVVLMLLSQIRFNRTKTV